MNVEFNKCYNQGKQNEKIYFEYILFSVLNRVDLVTKEMNYIRDMIERENIYVF